VNFGELGWVLTGLLSLLIAILSEDDRWFRFVVILILFAIYMHI